jgi:hypothetical protein
MKERGWREKTAQSAKKREKEKEYGQSMLVVESNHRVSQFSDRRDHGKHTEKHIGDIHYNLLAIISVP